MMRQTGRQPIANVIAARQLRMLEISRAQSAVKPVILELRSHGRLFRLEDLRRGRRQWMVELSEGTAKMDEDDYMPEVAIYTPNELSQWATSMVELAAAVDATENKEARRLLLKAMDGFAFCLNPPRGQLEEFKK